MRTRTLLVFVSLAVGCSGSGWIGKAGEFCTQALSGKLPRVPVGAELVAAIAEASNRDEAHRECDKALEPAIQACSEHRFGSDSALSCIERRVEPALAEFVSANVKSHKCAALKKEELSRYLKLDEELKSVREEDRRLIVASATMEKEVIEKELTGYCLAQSDAVLNCMVNGRGEPNRYGTRSAKGLECKGPIEAWQKGFLDLLSQERWCLKRFSDHQAKDDILCQHYFANERAARACFERSEGEDCATWAEIQKLRQACGGRKLGYDECRKVVADRE